MLQLLFIFFRNFDDHLVISLRISVFSDYCYCILYCHGYIFFTMLLGYVTTFHAEDLELMHELLHKQINPIEKAGIHPTADQVGCLGFEIR